MGNKLDMTLAILNGLVGDHLVRTKNGLATELGFIHEGRELSPTKASLTQAFPSPSKRVVVFVHGLMCTETIWLFPDGKTDYGTLLESEHGYTALRVRYNSGRPIADNGIAFAALLDALVEHYPTHIEELLLVGFSMGGLVIRSAFHHRATESIASNEKTWLDLTRRVIYVGTPHRGSPVERAGKVLVGVLRYVPDPYTRLIADISDLRSSGLKDLGEADLRHEDRAITESRRPRFSLRDPRHPVPLLPRLQHYLAAGTLSAEPRLAIWFGDSLVPVPSGTADAVIDKDTLALPPDHVKVFAGFSHVRLAHDPLVYEQIREWAK